MSPIKPLSLQIDDAIANDIYYQEHERDQEPEQVEMFEGEEI